MNAVHATQIGAVEDPQLVELVDEITAKLQAGETCDVDYYTARYPKYADRLRDWLTVMSAMADLGHSLAIDGANRAVLHSGTQGDTADLHRDDFPTGILGDYRILRELGRGGMGVVYEAEQISLGRRVALKVLPFAAMLDKQQLARFKNEARAAATLDHPNIVAIYSVGSERGVHYYAMQLIEGQSLAEIIADMKPGRPPSSEETARPAAPISHLAAYDTAKAALPTVRTTGSAAFSSIPPFDSREYYRAVARLGIQAAEALDHAHQNGILHRDIKPANLLLDDTGKLWITDFGLARIEHDAGMTMTGDLLGTLRYMSPEQALAKRVVVDHRSDIYSLGITLYELLTLQPAFTGDNRLELLRQIAFDEPRKPRQINPLIPQDLETIVLTAIDKSPADRFATATELRADLQRFVECKPIAAKSPTLFEHIRKWTVRHATMVILAGGALVTLAAILAAAATLTFDAYRDEARQRIAAEVNLSIASESIDRMLSRVANDQYHHGDLAHAETLAADATEFYEKLLTHSDDPELRFRAAEAQEEVAEIWLLVDKPEKALAAAHRSIELVRQLIAADPREAKYLNARGAAYLSLGRAVWGSERKSQAEEPWHQAAADFQLLADMYPHEPKYQGSLACAFNNLGLYCWVFGRTEGAEDCYRRMIELVDKLPRSFAETPEVLSRKAGTLSNWAMLRREQGDPGRAIELLDEANALLKQALKTWPTNPVAVDFLYNHYWQLAETCRQAGQPEAAARTIDALVWAMPDRLDAYCQGAELLVRCADLAETQDPSPAKLGAKGGIADGHSKTNPRPVSSNEELGKRAGPTVRHTPGLSKDPSVYRQRARDLIAKSRKVPTNTPERTNRFAWFLLTCRDESLRDPPRALELAKSVVERTPERYGAWLTLALAHYRNGQWPAAGEALQKSISLSPDAAPQIRHLLLGVMIRSQQGHIDEARQWRDKAQRQLEHVKTEDEELRLLAAEAAVSERDH